MNAQAKDMLSVAVKERNPSIVEAEEHKSLESDSTIRSENYGEIQATSSYESNDDVNDDDDSIALDDDAESIDVSTVASSNSSKVTFASGTKHSFVMSPDGADYPKSSPELLQALTQVRHELSQCQVDLSAEKALRKKKERNLMKTVKQIGVISKTVAQKESTIAELICARTSMETQVQALKLELSAQVEAKQNAANMYTAELAGCERKLREVRREHEQRISDLIDSHSKHCEELRQKILASYLEADKQRAIAASVKLGHNAKGADRAVIDQTVAEAFGGNNTKPLYLSKERMRFIFRAIILLVIMVVSGKKAFDWSKEIRLQTQLTRNGFCSPILTNRRYKTNFQFDAPYIVPEAFKQTAFNLFCGDRPRTRVKLHNKYFSIIDIREIRSQGGGVLKSKSNVGNVLFREDHYLVTVETLNRRGKLSRESVVDINPWYRV
mmetsp:Transcript_24322/g.37492  ORF Transcript_24322/g.37492 Transcript_24322/m.37492 type:complete len:440 (+) Transcript_24322:115-1434(+)|eukprot:CAMPEP_0196809006 /NCGR_PEP_ID=MMETSP1362-20130617/8971_1 /TAXON_ID=163516 /ORGANISM="Leptocylindrus danicus, Strain CCMP1856" /LENGTH=439 /DNA_ID=CAMNT_0042183541 /DNA_START=108 /DNA_END=1427 /DNA_ORIENTATION=+